MKGYAVRVDELAPKNDARSKENWLFVEPMETEKQYPIPSAFAAYVPYLNIKQGKNSFKEGE